jgi:hypothetical protein
MKLRLMSAVAVVLAVATMSFTPHAAQAPLSIVVAWEKESHDFGEIPQGKPVTVSFSFTNKGDEPILIADVATSCGCTASDYSKEPILPGASSTITATYNAAAAGAFNKSITVNFNEPSAKKVLLIKGTVK